MDSITQAALGSLCGELTMRKQLGWKAVVWGFFFGTLPDLDILISPLLNPIDRLGWHRGISHSLLAMFLGSAVFGYLLAKLHRKKGITTIQASGFVLLTWSTHVLIDCFTTYGTQIYEPFLSKRVALNNMSIIDISFTLPILLALLLVLFFRKDSNKRSWIGRCAILWLCSYTALSFYFKHLATRHFEQRLSEEGINPRRMMTAPTLSNIFLWRMITEAEGYYYISYWSLFDDPSRRDSMDKIPNGHEHLGDFSQSPEMKKLIWLAQEWHQVIPVKGDPNSLLLVDMRFSEMHTNTEKSPIFAWYVSRNNASYSFRNASLRKGVDPKLALKFLWQRIAGQAPDWMDGTWTWED